MNFLNQIPTENLHLLAVSLFTLLAACWQLRPAVLRRLNPPQPLALVLSDAILAGSRIDLSRTRLASDVTDSAARPLRPMLGELERLNERGQWGFSLQEAGRRIATFAYPGWEEARAAREAMEVAFKDLAFVLASTMRASAQPDEPCRTFGGFAAQNGPLGRFAASKSAAAI